MTDIVSINFAVAEQRVLWRPVRGEVRDFLGNFSNGMSQAITAESASREICCKKTVLNIPAIFQSAAERPAPLSPTNCGWPSMAARQSVSGPAPSGICASLRRHFDSHSESSNS
jgi:hypothetical protein